MERNNMKTHPGKRVCCAALLGLALLGAGCGKGPASTSTSAQSAVVAKNLTDDEVTANVRTALVGSAELKRYDIVVMTTKGDVLVSGMLDKQAQIDDVLKIARNAQGAHSVHDELRLKK
jgi:osmotically-inducible protein OsmY